MHAHRFVANLEAHDFVTNFGFVKKVGNSFVEANGPISAIGDICSIELESDHEGQTENELSCVDAEVVGIEQDYVTLVPFQQNAQISPNARVISKPSKRDQLAVGDAFSGRAINALGEPIDGNGPLVANHFSSKKRGRLDALSRVSSRTPMATGIKAIDTLLTFAKGQRIGVFAAAGVGKTTLVDQLSRQIEADRVIICLVGERGQEVEGMWQTCQSLKDKDRFTFVASTSDESAALRVRAPKYALMLAEHWRDQGEHVLLVMDSATRLAMALREVGLAAGEPPTVRAYTPNVFSTLPSLVEKCGAIKSGGAISAVLTILAEHEDVNDPFCEMMKSILDGHIVLSRHLSEQGHFPAIDIGRSISRQASKVMSAEQNKLAQTARKSLAVYEESRTFIESGVYKEGTNSELDEAIAMRGRLNEFLVQNSSEANGFSESFSELSKILGGAQ